MIEASLLGSLGIIGVLFISFIPVSLSVGSEMSRVMGLYVMGFAFRALFNLGAFFNGARIEVLIGIMVSVVLEVVMLIRIAIEESKREMLI